MKLQNRYRTDRSAISSASENEPIERVVGRTRVGEMLVAQSQMCGPHREAIVFPDPKGHTLGKRVRRALGDA